MLSVDGLLVEIQDNTLFGPIDFSLGPGELLHIKGKNGAGKTSLLKTMLGLMDKSAGKVLFEGKTFEHAQSDIGYIGHKLALTPQLTVKENVSLLTTNQAIAMPIEKAIDKVGLRLYMDTSIENLSEGQKKRASLVRFFYLKKKLWLIDEPFSALDKEQQDVFRQALTAYVNKGGMVILSSHLPLSLMDITARELALS